MSVLFPWPPSIAYGPKQYAIAYGRVKLAGPDTRDVGWVGAFFGKFQETKKKFLDIFLHPESNDCSTRKLG